MCFMAACQVIMQALCARCDSLKLKSVQCMRSKGCMVAWCMPLCYTVQLQVAMIVHVVHSICFGVWLHMLEIVCCTQRGLLAAVFGRLTSPPVGAGQAAGSLMEHAEVGSGKQTVARGVQASQWVAAMCVSALNNISCQAVLCRMCWCDFGVNRCVTDVLHDFTIALAEVLYFARLQADAHRTCCPRVADSAAATRTVVSWVYHGCCTVPAVEMPGGDGQRCWRLFTLLVVSM